MALLGLVEWMRASSSKGLAAFQLGLDRLQPLPGLGLIFGRGTLGDHQFADAEPAWQAVFILVVLIVGAQFVVLDGHL